MSLAGWAPVVSSLITPVAPAVAATDAFGGVSVALVGGGVPLPLSGASLAAGACRSIDAGAMIPGPMGPNSSVDRTGREIDVSDPEPTDTVFGTATGAVT
jgi:hypothetical protein